MASHFGDLPVRRLQGLLDHMLGAAPAAAALGSLDETIALAIPPRGVELPGEMVKAMEARCAAVEARLSAFVEHDLYADIAIATKAVRFAIKYHEFNDQRPMVQRWIDTNVEGPSGKALTPERKAQLEAMLAKMPSATAAADACLEMAEARLDELEGGASIVSWADPTAAASAPYDHGCVVRGYISVVDGTPQPYGLELPAEAPAPGQLMPLYVWLHGRGAAATDVHFIRERMRSSGGMTPLDGGIVLHPFGRQCLGYKSAGAIDVLHAIEDVKAKYPIDSDRIVLYGFSMGGAGSWSIGAHYPDLWAAVQPGAGFAETYHFYDDEARPQDGPSGEYGEPRLPAPEGPIHGRAHVRDLPSYEIALWGEGDATAYVRNLFNVPVIAYSGENDRQMQASRIMEKAYAAEGMHLPHIVGPGMGHAFHPDTKAELMVRLAAEVRKGRDTNPDSITLQTRTLRYNKCHWLTIDGLGEHWIDARLDAKRVDYTHSTTLSAKTQLVVTASNVTAFSAAPFLNMHGATVLINGQTVAEPTGLDLPITKAMFVLNASTGNWEWIPPTASGLPPAPRVGCLQKAHLLQGPIDDAFYDPFIVVTPTGSTPGSPAVDAYIEFELAHFIRRWEAVFRGSPRIMKDTEINQDQLRRFNVVLFGTPQSNVHVATVFNRTGRMALPIEWADGTVRVGGQSYDAATHVPSLVYPSCFSDYDVLGHYVVVNSGVTSREGHDHNNSLQNPHLPDWAVVDITTPPSRLAPGKIAAADFFDEYWQLRVK